MQDKTNKNSELSGLNLDQLIQYWTVKRFPTAIDEYRKEWVLRHRNQGHSAFLAHMDGDSRRTWYLLYSEWAALNFPVPQHKHLSAYCETCATKTIINHEDPELAYYTIKECSICGTQIKTNKEG